MTNEQHNKLIGIGFLVHGSLQLLFMLLMVAMFGSVMLMIQQSPRPHDAPPPFFFVPFIGFVVIIQSVFTIPSFVAAYAVLKRKTWARLAAIIGAVLSAMNVPIGTAVCVYALWFFFGENWKHVYPHEAGGASAQLHGGATEWANQTSDARREQTTPPPPDWR